MNCFPIHAMTNKSIYVFQKCTVIFAYDPAAESSVITSLSITFVVYEKREFTKKLLAVGQ